MTYGENASLGLSITTYDTLTRDALKNVTDLSNFKDSLIQTENHWRLLLERSLWTPTFNRTTEVGNTTLVLIGLMNSDGELFMATSDPGRYVSLDNRARHLEYGSTLNVERERPVGWRIITIDFGAYPGPKAFEHIRQSAPQIEEAPRWLLPWLRAVQQSVRQGSRFMDAARQEAIKPQLFTAEGASYEKARRWFLIDEKLQEVRVYYKNPELGWLGWVIKEKSGSFST